MFVRAGVDAERVNTFEIKFLTLILRVSWTPKQMKKMGSSDSRHRDEPTCNHKEYKERKLAYYRHIQKKVEGCWGKRYPRPKTQFLSLRQTEDKV
jgi:hypothetical protein